MAKLWLAPSVRQTPADSIKRAPPLAVPSESNLRIARLRAWRCRQNIQLESGKRPRPPLVPLLTKTIPIHQHLTPKPLIQADDGKGSK